MDLDPVVTNPGLYRVLRDVVTEALGHEGF